VHFVPITGTGNVRGTSPVSQSFTTLPLSVEGLPDETRLCWKANNGNPLFPVAPWRAAATNESAARHRQSSEPLLARLSATLTQIPRKFTPSFARSFFDVNRLKITPTLFQSDFG
jgi:hypothetical protein